MATITAAPAGAAIERRTAPPSRAELHARIAPFAKPNSLKGYLSFAIDVALYALGIAAVVLADTLWLQIGGGLLAGLALVNLGSLSLEAAHRSMVKSKLGNKVIAVITLTMILFNYRLWIYDHHVLHHGRTNVKHNNFLSPHTLAEFRALPRWRRALYRAYHTPGGAGILLYYLLERWPTVHYVPGAWLPAKFRASAWGYAALMTAWMAALLSVLVLVPAARDASMLAAVLCGFVLPYTIWFTTFAMTAFLQHTNPQLRWYGDIAGMASPPEQLAVHVKIPHIVNHVTHYVLEHNVHHLSAMVPHYNLKRAQAALADVVDPGIIVMPFGWGTMNDVLRRCRLYDYEAHAWQDFDGAVTAIPIDSSRRAATPKELTADLLPDEAQPGSPGIFFPASSGVKTGEAAKPNVRQRA
jgi:omega-6 fatty acid desaturase (delta-12 desaturase)